MRFAVNQIKITQTGKACTNKIVLEAQSNQELSCLLSKNSLADDFLITRMDDQSRLPCKKFSTYSKTCVK